MKKSLLLIVVLMVPAVAVQAEPPAGHKSRNPDRAIAAKRATSGNACAAYGEGFAKVEGSDTCVRIGGAVSNGASAYMGAR